MRLLRRSYDARAQAMGLTLSRARALTTLSRMDGATQAELAAALEIEAPTLKRQMDGKAEALFLDTLITGATLDTGLQKALNEAIAKLPIPKVMTYQLQEGTPLPVGLGNKATTV